MCPLALGSVSDHLTCFIIVAFFFLISFCFPFLYSYSLLPFLLFYYALIQSYGHGFLSLMIISDIEMLLIPILEKSFLKIYLLFIYLIYLWLHQVLVTAHEIFTEACGIFPCGAWALCCRAWASLWLWHVGFLFSSCGTQAPGCMCSVVCGTQIPERVGCELCSMWALVEARELSSCGTRA